MMLNQKVLGYKPSDQDVLLQYSRYGISTFFKDENAAYVFLCTEAERAAYELDLFEESGVDRWQTRDLRRSVASLEKLRRDHIRAQGEMHDSEAAFFLFDTCRACIQYVLAMTQEGEHRNYRERIQCALHHVDSSEGFDDCLKIVQEIANVHEFCLPIYRIIPFVRSFLGGLLTKTA